MQTPLSYNDRDGAVARALERVKRWLVKRMLPIHRQPVNCAGNCTVTSVDSCNREDAGRVVSMTRAAHAGEICDAKRTEGRAPACRYDWLRRDGCANRDGRNPGHQESDTGPHQERQGRCYCTCGKPDSRGTQQDCQEGSSGKVVVMAARLDTVAKYICKKSGWSVSNLELQKLVYLAQMIYLGRHGHRLVDANFQAWDYGPVEPRLYHKAKVFGADPVQDVFYDALRFKETDPRSSFLDSVCDKFLKYTAGELVDITHSDNGAWAKHYVPKARNTKIPDEDIIAEYRARTGKQ